MDTEKVVCTGIMNWLYNKTHVRVLFDKDIECDGKDYLIIRMDIRRSSRSDKNKRIDKFVVTRHVNPLYSDKAVSNILDKMYEDALSMMEKCR